MSLPDFEKKQWLVIFSHEDERVSFKNDNIVIKNGVGKVIHQSTCYRLFCLMIIGPTYLTSGIIERSKKFGFSIFFMNFNFRVYEALLPENRGNLLLRQKQYQQEGFPIARQIIVNKIENQLALLKKVRQKSDGIKTAIQGLEKYLIQVERLNKSVGETLLGYEGMSSRLYFQNYFKSIGWKRRSPRSKEDIPNLLLDMGYTYLFNLIETLLVFYGFDVYKGVYHQPFYQRKSLVCDLVEPFRPIIDHTLKKSYGLKQIDEADFERKGGRFYIPYSRSKKYAQLFIKSIGQYRLNIFKYVQSYYRAFMRDKPGNTFPKFLIEIDSITTGG